MLKTSVMGKHDPTAKSELEPIIDIAYNPETALSYFCAVSDNGETMGQTLAHQEFNYQDNVSVTAAALLDGVQRNEMIESKKDNSEFIEEVIDEMKLRNDNRVAASQMIEKE